MSQNPKPKKKLLAFADKFTEEHLKKSPIYIHITSIYSIYKPLLRVLLKGSRIPGKKYSNHMLGEAIEQKGEQGSSNGKVP